MEMRRQMEQSTVAGARRSRAQNLKRHFLRDKLRTLERRSFRDGGSTMNMKCEGRRLTNAKVIDVYKTESETNLNNGDSNITVGTLSVFGD
jgi:hypothetical protein